MFSTSALTIVAGTTGFLGFISLLAYFFLYMQTVRRERSLRDVLKNEGLANPDAVVRVLEVFQNDESRLKALRDITRYDNKQATSLLERVSNNVDLSELYKRNQSGAGQALLTTAVLFGILACLGAFFALATDEKGQTLLQQWVSPSGATDERVAKAADGIAAKAGAQNQDAPKVTPDRKPAEKLPRNAPREPWAGALQLVGVWRVHDERPLSNTLCQFHDVRDYVFTFQRPTILDGPSIHGVMNYRYVRTGRALKEGAICQSVTRLEENSVKVTLNPFRDLEMVLNTRQCTIDGVPCVEKEKTLGEMRTLKLVGDDLLYRDMFHLKKDAR